MQVRIGAGVGVGTCAGVGANVYVPCRTLSLYWDKDLFRDIL